VSITVNIEKRHILLILFAIVLVGGLITVVAQTPSTSNPGHSVAEVPGATPNCLTDPADTWCLSAGAPNHSVTSLRSAYAYNAGNANSANTATTANTANTATTANTANTATTANNANALGGVGPSGYCRGTGAGCKPMDQANCQWRSTTAPTVYQFTCQANEYVAGYQNTGLTNPRYYCCRYI